MLEHFHRLRYDDVVFKASPHCKNLDDILTIDLKGQIKTYWHERANRFDDIASHRREADAWERVLTMAVGDSQKGPVFSISVRVRGLAHCRWRGWVTG
ncbi:MAG: hypothetical protein HC871_10870 [Rhizobiales bacterium]|nr:hypothetical protein [Hyphomicrobiales bacterium]